MKWLAYLLSLLPSHGPDLKPREHNGYSDHYPPPATWGPRLRYRDFDTEIDRDFDCVSEVAEQAATRANRRDARNED
jgi:hypothetical protein